MNILIKPDPVCPVCHSTQVRAYKVFTDNEWWHQCVSGFDHGTWDDGKNEGTFPKDPWFTDSGKVELYADKYVTILKQEGCPHANT